LFGARQGQGAFLLDKDPSEEGASLPVPFVYKQIVGLPTMSGNYAKTKINGQMSYTCPLATAQTSEHLVIIIGDLIATIPTLPV
jgi:hypothetical protein